MKTAFELFQDVLVGDFDNRRQVEAAQKEGNQQHPFAVHVNRLFTHRIEGLDPEQEGCYILEESYYTYPEEEMTIKPHLFFIEPIEEDVVRLTPIKMPEHWDLKDIRNDNPDLKFHIDELKPVAWFNPAHYQMIGEKLYVNNPNDLGDGKRFTLIETLSKNRLEVMELLEQNGQRLTPYDSPIIYERLL